MVKEALYDESGLISSGNRDNFDRRYSGKAKRLARGTRAKARNAMSALYNHAIQNLVGADSALLGRFLRHNVDLCAGKYRVETNLNVAGAVRRLQMP
jgi:hypothetical protein